VLSIPVDKPFYRNDIQGLRGFAVLLIVIYHSGFTLPGGYVGVDVFFVISGFVITQLLIREISAKTPRSLFHFYKRRLKRLLPASSIAVAIVVMFSFLALAPENLLAVSTLAKSTVFLGANFNVLSGPGYFSSKNPLEHMWSLAVEEQFYLFYPVFILTVWHFFGRSKHFLQILAFALFSIGMVSFIGNILLSNGRISVYVSEYFHTTPERFAFFMMPTRVWEFFAGAIIALFPLRLARERPIFYNISTLVGFLAILFASITYDAATKFPGIAALLPVCGTVLIIAHSPRVQIAQKVLTSRVMLYFGAISYSWYLWHWPAIVFSQILYPRSSMALISAIALSLGIANFSYKLVESKFRVQLNGGGQWHSVWVLAISLCVLSPSLAAQFTPFLQKQIHSQSDSFEPTFSESRGCHDSNANISPSCIIQNETTNVTVFLVGDSHANAASDGISSAATGARVNFAVQSFNGCPPFPIKTGDGCSSYRAIIEQTIKDLNPTVVVLAVAIDAYVDRDFNITKEVQPEYISNYVEYVRYLVNDGRKVFVLLEVPRMSVSGQRSILRKKLATKTTSLAKQHRREAWLGLLNTQLSTLPNVELIDTENIFCRSGTCYPRQDGLLLYWDPTHLTVAGSHLLTPIFSEKFQVLFQTR
jgi:peptidoglycan/LPS O-acetylase OafA/YrhL